MRNKKIADVLLIILSIAFCISVFLKIHFHNNFYVRMIGFVIEAALVGGIADWFAVTALFKKPLGFSWHTAVIPRNRVKVVEQIVNVVENELLSKKILKEKIDELNIIDSIIEFIENSAKNKTVFYRQSKDFVEDIMGRIDSSNVTSFIEENFRHKLKECNLSLCLSSVLKFAVEDKHCKIIFKSIVEEVIIKIDEEKVNKEISKIIDKLVEDNVNKVKGFKKVLMEFALGLGKGTNTINVGDIASSIQEQIIEMLYGLKDEEELVHIEFLNKIQILIGKLKDDEELINSIEKWKQKTIAKIEVQDELQRMVTGISYIFKNESDEKIQSDMDNLMPLIKWAKNELHNYWNHLKSDNKFKSTVNDYIKELIYDMVKSSYGLIGTVIKKVLNNMTDESLNNFIQLKAGNELNWIRINGSIIGAIFGFIVFLFINQVYLPLITKIFHL
ncbi:DUF445 domain-containing protein [Clostridium kluyveri]|uniref:DUF445 domain-containing protein n=1 Tax=Clostridium kluyveri TaxID=1534 RepID=UPI002246BFA3|nr:DUF445 domain-containing protein [Clostridium kluyveri]UZQ52164.1 DUF445 domain-containing protein [Clostridium kluyveri]